MDWTRRGIDNPLRAFLVDTELLLSLYFFDKKSDTCAVEDMGYEVQAI